jgi:RHS repeat-associated protein
MARTAPVPNFPAIPGMNPGIFLLGGGGDAGGSGAGRGKGKGKKQKGKGKNGGKNAKGGGKNAGKCGAGKGGACPNPKHGKKGTSAGDPVDPLTGRVYTSTVVDLSLDGPVPLVIARAYTSSQNDVDMGLGFGWSHTMGWVIEERRRTLRIFEPLAASTDVERPEIGAPIRLPCGLLSRHEWGYTLDSGGRTYVFAERQESVLRLSSVRDARGNAISLQYEGVRLTRLLDSVGRVVRVRYHTDGHIAAFEVKNASQMGRWTSFRSYGYDAAGNLVAATDALGYSERFEYDEDHHLVRRAEAGGLTAYFLYDGEGRCVESWCEHASNDGLDAATPGVLDDGSKAKGFLHVRLTHGDGMTEVVTSRTKRRVEGDDFDDVTETAWSGGIHSFEYDVAGEMLAYTDGQGHTWQMDRDDHGRLLRTVDPLGGAVEYTYDDRGWVRSVQDSLGHCVEYTRDAAGDVIAVTDNLGPVASFRYDDRGYVTECVLPNGGVTRMEHDALGHRVRVVEPDGASRRISYDFLGRMTATVDERGLETRYGYDDMSRIVWVRYASGATLRYTYDADGNLASLTDRDGRTTWLVWGGSGVVTEVKRPDGTEVHFRYDREQELVRVVNESGDEYVYVRSGEGRIVEERTFDGRTIHYKHDAEGRITKITERSRAIELAYDALGRLVERAYSDGRKDTIAYDAMGRMTRVETSDITCEYTYDVRGRRVRESLSRGAERWVFDTVYDALDLPAEVSGPTGSWKIGRDVAGRPTELAFGDVAPVRFTYDVAGNLTERALPQGGRIVEATSGDGMRAWLQVQRASGPQVGSGEPSWVGAAPGVTFARSYGWSADGLLTAVGEGAKDGPFTEWKRDVNGRVLERRRVHGAKQTALEAFGYGPAGDAVEPAVPREYGPGGRLLGRGEVSFEYDEYGRIVEKRSGDKVWSFTWGDDDLLHSVRTPAGDMVSFVYDSLARRIEKRVERGGRLVDRTRYVWFGDRLAGETRERGDGGGDVQPETRSYLFLPNSHLPLGDRVGDGPWRYYVDSPTGAAHALVHGDGSLAGELDPSLFGKVAADRAALTPLRQPGQYEDEETGLHYNRYRYYDPDTGQYISPEPLRLAGGMKAYQYTEGRPSEFMDIDGLDKERMNGTVTGTATDANGNPVDVNGNAQSGYDKNWNKPADEGGLHPAVKQALPSPGAKDKKDGEKLPPNPASCAEPKVMSDYLKNWEKATGKKIEADKDGKLTPEGKKNLNQALKDIKNVNAATSTDNSTKPACPNCTQTMARLWKLGGIDPNDPEHGLQKKMPGGGSSPGKTTYGTDFKPDYKDNTKFPPDDLGKWHQNPDTGKWENL